MDELTIVLIEDRCHDGGFALSREPRKAKQKNARGRKPLPVHQFPEVLVTRDEERLFPPSVLEDPGVVDTGGELGDIRNVVPIGPKPLDDVQIDPFVRDELHAASSGVG